MKEITIGKNEVNKRFDGFLKSYFPNASMGFLYKMLRKKNITLNGKKADGKEKLNMGDKIEIFFADDTFDKFRGDSSNDNFGAALSFKEYEKIGLLPIVYEDANILLVNKPVGLLSQKSKADDYSLNEWLIDHLLKTGEISEKELETYRPSICNRLDRNTSGLVICAKSLLGARCMNEMLRDRTLDKYYRTIVCGRLSEVNTLKGYLYKDEKKNKVFISKENPGDNRYSYIETKYTPIAYNKELDLTLLEVKLITGKTHQIRAHLSSIKHPILGDIKYGQRAYKGVNYQLLHSYRVEFPLDLDPELSNISGRHFVADMPDIYREIFNDI